MRALMLMVAMLASAAAAGEFTLVAREHPIENNPDLHETVWQAQVGESEYDRIGLHRIAGPGEPVAQLLYLPGTNMNGEIALTDEAYNLWLYLARRGVVVYTLDYRTHFVPNEPVPEDLGFMRGWTMHAFVSDAERAVGEMRRHADLPLFVAGFSRGAGYGYALAGQVSLAGLIALDGSFKSWERDGFDADAARQALSASGQWGSVLSRSRGWAGRTELMERAATDPSGPAMGKFDSIGAQLFETLYYAWGEGGLANPVDGISRIDVLARAMIGYDRVFPSIQNIEGRSIASHDDDPSTAIDDHFGEMSVPILYFGATNMGADSLMSGIYSASKSGSDDVTLHVLERHGHLDVLYGELVESQVFAVIRDWINDRVAAPSRQGEPAPTR